MTTTAPPAGSATTGPPSEASPAPRPRGPWRPVPAVVGFLAAWVALFSWSGMIAEPSGFLVPVGVGGLVLALVGSLLRLARVASYAVAAVQAVLGVLLLNLFFASGQSLLGVVPTGASLQRLAVLVENGARALNYYAAPVESFATSTQALLAACGLLVVYAVDVLALGLRRPPLAALPLLVALSVPVTILLEDLALPVFVVVALLFVRLLAAERHDRWARGRDALPRRGPDDGRTVAEPGRGLVWQVSLAAVALALLVAPLVPVSDALPDDGTGEGPGTGAGDIRLNTTVNPFISLRRELIEQTATPLVYARTDADQTAYLRTTVLDSFTGQQWRPSQRDLPSDNLADGVLPGPPGLAAGTGGPEADWDFELASAYSTSWLPLPYPLREIAVEGNWRYDERTFDVALVRGRAPQGLEYAARSFTPRVTAAQLDSALRPPASVRETGTALPRDLPPVIAQTAREVTAGADTAFAQAVALQDWFRTSGGFTYSLEQRNGSGMQLLADFVTTDRIGYCEQFAAAMATMARTLGIPARIAVGFLSPEQQPDGRLLYTSDTRHAWPELYFSGAGWVRFEPTPGGRTGATPSYTRQSPDEPTAAPTPSDEASPEAAPEPEQLPEDAADGSGGGGPLPWGSLLVPVALVLLAGGPTLVRRRQRDRRLGGASGSPDGPTAEDAWAELRAVVLDEGRDWPSTRTPREQARRVLAQADGADPQDLSRLEAMLVEVERDRYSGAGGVRQAVRTEDVRDTLATWQRLLRRTDEGRVARWRRRWWPASLTTR
ncbi:transglutaminaseTgpA domain-containing protein [Nocardioides aurantiacus]|uniref:Transglutaminase-like putative cysteine protease n=1 Tax=Nocardioides aurantiacus TaxID=86796 RepID=A0A3N2CWY5_9ACTN|nr:DUF3488 and transglutaminase-like domain-containing protein [Nocardioides aurantiacus]ROR92045.1 transglutaminase-like putative cysteine protease [Nocardioides aurantiacus]